MGKIISTIPNVEAVHESAQKIEEVFSFEMEQVDIKPRVIGLTSVGYDDEIGLWEELLYRHSPNKAATE
jgi:hypothetical protein